MENPVNALLFGNNPDISMDERARVLTELNKIGSLTFEVSSDEDGWAAQCKEVTGIIAGGINPNPSNPEVEAAIRDSIFAAFSVKAKSESPENFQASPFFTYGDFGGKKRNDSRRQLA